MLYLLIVIVLFYFNLTFLITKGKLNRQSFMIFVFPFIELMFPLISHCQKQLKKISIHYKIKKNLDIETLYFIDYLLSYLKAGVVLSQAVHYSYFRRKWNPFLDEILGKTVQMLNHGKSMQDTLNEALQMIGTKKRERYLRLIFTGIKLGQATGGNTVQVLGKVRRKIETSFALQQKIQTATAQIRIQSRVIIAAPFMIGILIWMFAPHYIIFFFEPGFGRILLLLMILLNVVGAYFLKKIAEIED